MENAINNEILIQVHTKHLSREEYENKIRAKVTKVAEKYWKKNYINIQQFSVVVDSATKKLLNQYQNTREVVVSTQQSIIEVLYKEIRKHE